MTRKTDLHISRIIGRIGLKALLTIGVIVGGLFALPGMVHAATDVVDPTIELSPASATYTLHPLIV